MLGGESASKVLNIKAVEQSAAKKKRYSDENSSVLPSVVSQAPVKPRKISNEVFEDEELKFSERDDIEEQSSQEEDEFLNNQKVNAFENIQEKLFEIIENEEVEDCIDLNEKFLS